MKDYNLIDVEEEVKSLKEGKSKLTVRHDFVQAYYKYYKKEKGFTVKQALETVQQNVEEDNESFIIEMFDALYQVKQGAF